jgi:hypothetical protein
MWEKLTIFMVGFILGAVRERLLNESKKNNMNENENKALSKKTVSGRSEQLVCDYCKRYKKTNTLEDCNCGKGQMWVKAN